MKVKKCTKCLKHKKANLKNFYKHTLGRGGLTPACKTCLSVRSKIYRKNISYPAQETGEIVCTKCKQAKAPKLFSKSRTKHNGRNSWCKACIVEKIKETGYKYYTVYDPTKTPYRKTNPVDWNIYYTNYRRAYLNDPVRKAKDRLKYLLSYEFKKGLIRKPKQCEQCNKLAKTQAWFNDEKVKMVLDNQPITDLTPTKWLCSKCVCKKRKLK